MFVWGRSLVYKIPYRRASPTGRVRRASKGILHTSRSRNQFFGIFYPLRNQPFNQDLTPLWQQYYVIKAWPLPNV